MKRWKLLASLLAMMSLSLGFAQSTLALVRERGTLNCGVNGNLLGFSYTDEDGQFRGFDVDFCRAIASAVLGDADAVSYVPLSAQERFTALQSGKIDVLIRNTTWTSSRDAALDLSFTKTTFYDGQGIMVRLDSSIDELADLQGRTICVQQGTTTELNLADQLRIRGIDYAALIFVTNTQAVAAYREGLCDAFTTDKSGLVGSSRPGMDVVLDVTLSKEPLGPSVRQGDTQWFDLVQWVIFGLIQAEEYGINSDNLAAAVASDDPKIRRFLGVEGDLWEQFALDATVMQRVITQVGNYGEIYRRNLGPDTATYIPRGLNSLWTEDGLLYAPPMGR